MIKTDVSKLRDKQTKVAKLKVDKSINLAKDVADKYIDGKRDKCIQISGG
jgi:hypothetical protein